MDYRSRGSTREPQASSPVTANYYSSTTRRGTTPLHRCNYSCGQHGDSSRTSGGRPCLRCPETSLLHQRSTSESKVRYPLNLENSLWHPLHLQEASPLLRQVQELSCYWFPIGGYTPQSGHHWKNFKVGSRTGGLIRTRLRCLNNGPIFHGTRIKKLCILLSSETVQETHLNNKINILILVPQHVSTRCN